MGINILKNTGYGNITRSNGRSIKYIVLHYTAGVSSKPGAAFNTCNWFKNPNSLGSADFCVDDANIVQYNPNLENYYTWAVGGGKYPSMTTSLGGKFYNIVTNKNSISIEICSNKKNTSNLYANATDWYFTEASINKALELTKYLMNKYKIPTSNIVMHHMVTGKCCPNPWCVNEKALSGYRSFINRLTETTPKVPDIIDTKCKIAINGNIKEYLSKNVKGNNYVQARAFLTDLGYKVGFNNTKKRVTVDDKLALDVETIIDKNGSSFINLRSTIDFLNKYDTWKYTQDKYIKYDSNTKVIGIY